MLGALVLELGHAAQLAELGVAGQNPGKLSVSAHVALHEQHALLRVDAGGQQHGCGLPGLTAQGRGVLPHGDGMQVRHHVQAVVFFL